MKGAKQGGSRAKRLPVFVSPAELQFVGEDEASHKQILTLFNPYNFNIRFKGVTIYFTSSTNWRSNNFQERDKSFTTKPCAFFTACKRRGTVLLLLHAHRTNSEIIVWLLLTHSLVVYTQEIPFTTCGGIHNNCPPTSAVCASSSAVRSSAPHKYSVHGSQGTLNPRCCTDL